MPTTYIKELADKGKGSVEELEGKWDEAKAQAKKQGKGDNYSYITSIFKNMVGAAPLKIEAAHRLAKADMEIDQVAGNSEE